MQVSFFFETKVTLADRNRLKIFLKTLFNEEKREAESLSYIFCSDEYLIAINQQYLQHDYYTDIITFNLAENSNKPVVGDIYISVDRVKEN
ncbi:MAG: rRNA maturation RNase YbeY, partial [Bacteroidetes bacterium]|nr:rRNA maturation RNase YbeY [Bacteroidota bacterium]